MMMTDKPKLRWWQFSLRKFILLLTLFTVMAVAFWRLRKWGRELDDRLGDLSMSHWVAEADYDIYVNYEHGKNPRIKAQLQNDIRAIERDRGEIAHKYWLPIKVYKLTSWDSNK